ncbi:hypothetical protein G5I_03458 [Acromyrmex echinatior]|uniref:Uncharacterized protein n=1 Tax=Acromyrmex echinatior TaxID=103372 RepID=F4WD17_ACREC|nr:hypothetical protein G5I_03458 [Acromyrmex echinatior]
MNKMVSIENRKEWERELHTSMNAKQDNGLGTECVGEYSDSGAVMKSTSLNHRNDLNYRLTQAHINKLRAFPTMTICARVSARLRKSEKVQKGERKDEKTKETKKTKRLKTKKKRHKTKDDKTKERKDEETKRLKTKRRRGNKTKRRKTIRRETTGRRERRKGARRKGHDEKEERRRKTTFKSRRH